MLVAAFLRLVIIRLLSASPCSSLFAGYSSCALLHFMQHFIFWRYYFAVRLLDFISTNFYRFMGVFYFKNRFSLHFLKEYYFKNACAKLYIRTLKIRKVTDGEKLWETLNAFFSKLCFLNGYYNILRFTWRISSRVVGAPSLHVSLS